MYDFLKHRTIHSSPAYVDGHTQDLIYTVKLLRRRVCLLILVLHRLPRCFCR